MSRPRPSTFLALLVGAVLLAGCGESPDASPEPPTQPEATSPALLLDSARPQTTSFMGDTLYAQVDTAGEIAGADSARAANPDDLDLLIQAGRVRRNHWRYREAMEIYTQAMEQAPEDWRPPRFRGHRYISLRDFDAAVADLERARDLAPLNWDVSYHLGLAYFLAGRFEDAADEYLRCLAMAGDEAAQAAEAEDFRSCSENADDPESRVAMTEWAVRALGRAGRADAAQALLDELATDLPVEVNRAYYDALLWKKGVLDESELLAEDAPYRLETVGYGIANQRVVQGDTAAALELLDRLVQDPWWPGFGRIAAEVDRARLGG